MRYFRKRSESEGWAREASPDIVVPLVWHSFPSSFDDSTVLTTDQGSCSTWSALQTITTRTRRSMRTSSSSSGGNFLGGLKEHSKHSRWIASHSLINIMLVWAGPLDAVLQSENLNNSDKSVVSGKYIYIYRVRGGGFSLLYLCTCTYSSMHTHFILACFGLWLK